MGHDARWTQLAQAFAQPISGDCESLPIRTQGDWLAYLYAALQECGSAVCGQLRSSFRGLSSSHKEGETWRFGDLLATFEALRQLSEEKIHSLPYERVGGQWLRLYVDSTIGLVMTGTLSQSTEADLMRHIGALDQAIIVAGAVGREDEIQEIIKQLQLRLCQDRRVESVVVSSSIPSKRKRRHSAEISGSSQTRNPIPTLDIPPSINKFLQTDRHKPFILRRFVAQPDDISNPYGMDWSAIQRWQSADYLLTTSGPGRMVPVEIGTSYTDVAWTQRIVPFSEFLDQIGYKTGRQTDPSVALSVEDSAPMYLAQYSLFKQFPELEKDIILPDYVYSAPEAPADYPSYQPPGNEEGVVVNVWVGGGEAKVTSPPHTVSLYSS